jgi:hypothetical protein
MSDSIFIPFFSSYWSFGIDVLFGLAPFRDSNILGKVHLHEKFHLGVAVPDFCFLVPFYGCHLCCLLLVLCLISESLD